MKSFSQVPILIMTATGLGIALAGCQGLLGQTSAPAPSDGEVRIAASRVPSPSEAVKRAKENSEILQEVLRVVYDREPENRAEFGSLVDSMNQGASIEGLYNGFTHSSEYRKLETENPGSRPEALGFFASELARTEAELTPPTDFGAETFSGASIFTLKRVLGDELLKLISQKSKDPKALQAWYGAWVVRMCGLGVDFGLPLRNKPDAEFHARWAATADSDRLKWEVLNRIQRVLNERNNPKKG